MSDEVAIVGAGPTGLIAAEVLSAAGKRVVIYERMPSVARKFLMAGRGGLNLTHSEPFAQFVTRYGNAAERLRPMLEAFTPDDLRAWADGLGAETFVGSSGRVFPKAMKASPLLRAWLRRLADQGVEVRTNTRGSLPTGSQTTLLALGGASWPRLGSDGSWRDELIARGVEVTPFQPANVGFNVDWSEHIRTRFAGQPLKGIAIAHNGHSVRGEAMITSYGMEGGAIYALSPDLRAAAPTTIEIDLRPALSRDDIAAKLARAKAGDSLSSTLRKTLGLSPLAISLLHENGPPTRDQHALADQIKAVPIKLTSPRGLDRAISTAGGMAWSAVDESLQLRGMPGVYVAGEMLDWEAPTGGYLLQASFATGVHAARAMLAALNRPC
jgi:uncharacterized flavoprotein (TIGR03862 family)